MLQNAKSVEEFETYLINIIIIFSSKYNSDIYFQALHSICREIKDRDMVREITNENDLNMESMDFRQTKHVFPVGEKVFKILKNDSPFKLHFNHVIDKSSKLINSNDLKNSKNEANLNFAPKFLDIIYDLLHIMPLWTGVLLAKWSKKYEGKLKFPVD
jgi:hypothetical protein